jgi:2-methylfumaryl-CoA isomerase
MTETVEATAALAKTHGVDFEHDEAARYEHRRALAEILGPWFAIRDRAAVEAELTAARVLSAPYRDFREAAARGGGPLAELDQPGIGPVISSESPMRWHDQSLRNVAATSRGINTEAVLRELAGVTEVEYASLIADGFVTAR